MNCVPTAAIWALPTTPVLRTPATAGCFIAGSYRSVTPHPSSPLDPVILRMPRTAIFFVAKSNKNGPTISQVLCAISGPDICSTPFRNTARLQQRVPCSKRACFHQTGLTPYFELQTFTHGSIMSPNVKIQPCARVHPPIGMIQVISYSTFSWRWRAPLPLPSDSFCVFWRRARFPIRCLSCWRCCCCYCFRYHCCSRCCFRRCYCCRCCYCHFHCHCCFVVTRTIRVIHQNKTFVHYIFSVVGWVDVDGAVVHFRSTPDKTKVQVAKNKQNV